MKTSFVEGKISESSGDNNDPTLKIENIILNAWDYVSINFRYINEETYQCSFNDVWVHIFGWKFGCFPQWIL